jgi:hypothetical protein
MSLSRRISISISALARTPTVPGFGVPLILDYHTHYTDLVRYYSDPDSLVDDGFSRSSPAYLAAVKLMSANPSVQQFAVGRRTHAPTKIVELTPTAVNDAIYTVTINGVTYTYTADTSTSAQEIATGLKALIAADTTLTGVLTPTDTSAKLTLTGVSGVYYSWSCGDNTGNANGMGKWSVKDTSVDSEAEEDIAACLAADSGWYAFMSTFENQADGALLAEWAENAKHPQIIALADSDLKTSSTADLATAVKAAAYEYTSVWYHQLPGEFFSAGFLGMWLPYDPGTETASFKTIAGQTADILTDNEITVMGGSDGASGKLCNFYDNLGGVNITESGLTGSGMFLDEVRGLDWQQSDMQVGVFTVILNNPKVPFTDPGIAMIEKEVRASLSRGVKKDFLSADPAPSVIVPRAADITTANKAKRKLTGITFTAETAGAIHKIEITGAVTP